MSSGNPSLRRSMSVVAIAATFSLNACASTLAGFAEPTSNLAREDMARMARQSTRHDRAYPIPSQEKIRSLSDAGTLSPKKYNLLVAAFEVVDVVNSFMSGIQIMGAAPRDFVSVSEALCRSTYKLGTAGESAVSFGPAGLRDQVVAQQCVSGVPNARREGVQVNIGSTRIHY